MKEDRTIPCPYGRDDVSKVVSSKVELLLFDIFDDFIIDWQGSLNPLVEVSQIHRRRVTQHTAYISRRSSTGILLVVAFSNPHINLSANAQMVLTVSFLPELSLPWSLAELMYQRMKSLMRTISGAGEPILRT